VRPSFSSTASTLLSSPESRVWYRAIQTHFLATALAIHHTATTSSRFSSATVASPGHQVLYLAEDPLVALLEVQALLGSPTTPGGIVPQELTGDWRGYQLRGPTTTVTNPTGIAPTQDLGAALYGVPKLEGFRTLSAKAPYQEILVVFPQKLEPGSKVSWFNPLARKTESLP